LLGLLYWPFWLALAITIAIITGRRNRCGYAWFMLGLLFNAVALAILLWLPP
jgi:hypothetical protein